MAAALPLVLQLALAQRLQARREAQVPPEAALLLQLLQRTCLARLVALHPSTTASQAAPRRMRVAAVVAVAELLVVVERRQLGTAHSLSSLRRPHPLRLQLRRQPRRCRQALATHSVAAADSLAGNLPQRQRRPQQQSQHRRPTTAATTAQTLMLTLWRIALRRAKAGGCLDGAAAATLSQLPVQVIRSGLPLALIPAAAQAQAQLGQLPLPLGVEIQTRGQSAAVVALAALLAATAADLQTTTAAASGAPLLLRLHQCSRNRQLSLLHGLPLLLFQLLCPRLHLDSAARLLMISVLGQRQQHRQRQQRLPRRRQLLPRGWLHRLLHRSAQQQRQQVVLPPWERRQLRGGGARLRRQGQSLLVLAQEIPLALQLQLQCLARVAAAPPATAAAAVASMGLEAAAAVVATHSEPLRLHLWLSHHEGRLLRRLLIRSEAALAAHLPVVEAVTHLERAAAAVVTLGAPAAHHRQLASAALLLRAMLLGSATPLLRCRQRCPLALAIVRCRQSQRPQIPPIRSVGCSRLAVASVVQPVRLRGP